MKYLGQITDAKDLTTKEYVDGKENRLTVATEWPEDNVFLANGCYQMPSQASDRSMIFDDGESAEDVIYVAIPLAADIELTTVGNCLGLEEIIAPEDHLLELIGVWNVTLGSWIFAQRRTLIPNS